MKNCATRGPPIDCPGRPISGWSWCALRRCIGFAPRYAPRDQGSMKPRISKHFCHLTETILPAWPHCLGLLTTAPFPHDDKRLGKTELQFSKAECIVTIAYVLNTYPQPSHTFIHREIR